MEEVVLEAGRLLGYFLLRVSAQRSEELERRVQDLFVKRALFWEDFFFITRPLRNLGLTTKSQFFRWIFFF